MNHASVILCRRFSWTAYCDTTHIRAVGRMHFPHFPTRNEITKEALQRAAQEAEACGEAWDPFNVSVCVSKVPKTLEEEFFDHA